MTRAAPTLRAAATATAAWSLALGGAWCFGCGTRTSLELGAPVAARDSGGPDASRLDAGGGGDGAADGAVVDAGDGDAGAIGSPCRRDADCGAGAACRRNEALAPADGRAVVLTCQPARAGLPERARCAPGGDACARGLCVLAGTCVAPCVVDADCSDGARCADAYARTAPRALQPLRACVPSLALPPDVRASLGVEVLAPPAAAVAVDALGATTVALFEHEGADRVRIEELTLDDGTVLYDRGRAVPGGPPPPNAVFSVGRAFDAILWPASPVVRPSRGGLSVRFAVERRARTQRIVLGRDAPGATLDLDVFLLAAIPTGPGGERGEAALREVVARAVSLISGGRLRLGELRVHEVVGVLLRRLAIVEDVGVFSYPELDEVHTLSAGTPGASVPVFLLRQIEGLVGVSGGIPGALGRPGSIASGVAISTELLGPPLTFDVVLAHELGHFFGLFHTSEFDGSTVESIPDTAVCSAERDADGDGLLAPEECAGAGAELLMFWAASGTTVTPQQVGVVARNPVALR